MKNHVLISRRRFVKTGAAAAVAVPLAGLLASRPSVAAEQISEDDPTAQAIGYVHDASAATDQAQYQEGANCANCQLYLKDQEADGWAPCPIVQGKLVKAEGWCTVWQKAAG